MPWDATSVTRSRLAARGLGLYLERAGLPAHPGEPVPHAVRPRDPRDGPERWLAQLEGRDAGTRGWRIGRDLHGLTGATLTAHAVGDAVRKVLALHATVIRPRQGG